MDDKDAMMARPWTAEIASPFDGMKSKYNIPLTTVTADGTVAALAVPLAAQPERSKTVKARKEEWAAAKSSKDAANGSVQLTSSPSTKSVKLVQGYFESNHPAFADRSGYA